MKLAVFDIDGTLVDSRATIAAAMDAAFIAVDLPPPGYDKVRAIVGLSLGPAIAGLAPTAGPALRADLQREYVSAFARDREVRGCDRLYEGAGALLRDLRREGWRLAVATGKSRAGLRPIFAAHQWDEMFDVISCADDGPGKPDPHMLEHNMRVLGARAGETIMIGDTSHDMAMARAAGAYAQGVAWGFHTDEEIVAGGAHHVAQDFPELAGALAAFAATA